MKIKRIEPGDIVSEIAKGNRIYLIDKLPPSETFGIHAINDIKIYDAMRVIQAASADKAGRFELYLTED